MKHSDATSRNIAAMPKNCGHRSIRCPDTLATAESSSSIERSTFCRSESPTSIGAFARGKPRTSSRIATSSSSSFRCCGCS
jgi:hypothetical protein